METELQTRRARELRVGDLLVIGWGRDGEPQLEEITALSKGRTWVSVGCGEDTYLFRPSQSVDVEKTQA